MIGRDCFKNLEVRSLTSQCQGVAVSGPWLWMWRHPVVRSSSYGVLPTSYRPLEDRGRSTERYEQSNLTLEPTGFLNKIGGWKSNRYNPSDWEPSIKEDPGGELLEVESQALLVGAWVAQVVSTTHHLEWIFSIQERVEYHTTDSVHPVGRDGGRMTGDRWQRVRDRPIVSFQVLRTVLHNSWVGLNSYSHTVLLMSRKVGDHYCNQRLSIVHGSVGTSMISSRVSSKYHRYDTVHECPIILVATSVRHQSLTLNSYHPPPPRPCHACPQTTQRCFTRSLRRTNSSEDHHVLHIKSSHREVPSTSTYEQSR